MKITVLSENTSAAESIIPEHGLSLFIETADKKILFDTGASELFYENALKLGIDISQADIAVLSHGHYDHTGGLKKFLEINSTAPVYLSKFAFEPHYNGTEKYIGMDISLADCGRLIFTEETTKLDENMSLHHCNDRSKQHDLGSFGLNTLENGEFVPDDFRHEQYLLIRENGRKILISGCSHKGIMDITEWFEPDVLVGGFHFSKLPLDNTLAGYADFLDGFKTEFYTCHCTGVPQYEFMKEHMSRLSYISAGQSIVI